jgi:hypothetical protein
MEPRRDIGVSDEYRARGSKTPGVVGETTLPSGDSAAQYGGMITPPSSGTGQMAVDAT